MTSKSLLLPEFVALFLRSVDHGPDLSCSPRCFWLFNTPLIPICLVLHSSLCREKSCHAA